MGRVIEDFLTNINDYTDEEVRRLAPDLTGEEIESYREDAE